jgi:hypothetical protein
MRDAHVFAADVAPAAFPAATITFLIRAIAVSGDRK